MTLFILMKMNMEMKNHKDDYDENDDVVKKAVCNQFHLSIA